MGIFERYLTLWVALCIVAGIALGQAVPGVFHAIGNATVAQVNLPVAILVWLMIVPMLLKIDPRALAEVGRHWRGIATTVGVNWLIKPFSMALLGWLFIGHLFRPLLPADQIDFYIAGLILLAAAPCTAMVFVWSNLVDGEPHFTLSQVALNDAIMVVAFAPIVGLLLGLSSISVPWDTLLLSVVLYIVVPVIVAQLWRQASLAAGGAVGLARTLRRLGPLSLAALLLTLVLLFGLQGDQIVHQPLVILLLAIPIIVQVYFNAGLAYWLNRRLGVEWCIAGPSALIGASNFFELAVATAIALFGFQSGAALATVVGVLVEVPVMLTVVRLVRASRPWYERGAMARRGQATNRLAVTACARFAHQRSAHTTDLSAAPAARTVAGHTHRTLHVSHRLRRRRHVHRLHSARHGQRHAAALQGAVDAGRSVRGDRSRASHAAGYAAHRAGRDRLPRPWHHGRHQHGDRAPRRRHRADHHAGDFATCWRSAVRCGRISTTTPCARRCRWCRASAAWRCRNASMRAVRCCSRWMRPKWSRQRTHWRRRASRRSRSASCTVT